jgi:hypothetical protein
VPLQRALDLTLDTDLELSDADVKHPGSVDVRFEMRAEEPDLQVNLSDGLEIRTPDGRPSILMGRAEGNYVIRFTRLADFVISPDGRRISCRPFSDTPAETVRHLLLGQVLPRIHTLRRRPALHGSSVLIADDAAAFLGQSAQGKSTLALAFGLSGCPVLADDCLLLRPAGDGVVVLPSLIGIRVWPDSAKSLLGESTGLPLAAHYTLKLRVGEHVAGLTLARREAPLRRLYVLDPVEDTDAPPQISRLNVSEAFGLLAGFVLRLAVDNPSVLRSEFGFLSDVVSRVQVRMLRFPAGYENLPAVLDAVRADLGHNHGQSSAMANGI